MKLLLASGNPKKLVELRRIVADSGLDIEVVGQADVTTYPEPVENGSTFEENALIKARAGVAATGVVTLADDSGIEVDVLNRMPGVRSARWAGPAASDAENLDLLLRQTADVEPARRTARFVAAVAVVTPDGREVVERGTMEGRLGTEVRGGNGFGYDPAFHASGHQRTNAELTPQEKDEISHRGQAIRAVLARFAEWGDLA